MTLVLIIYTVFLLAEAQWREVGFEHSCLFTLGLFLLSGFLLMFLLVVTLRCTEVRRETLGDFVFCNIFVFFFVFNLTNGTRQPLC